MLFNVFHLFNCELRGTNGSYQELHLHLHNCYVEWEIGLCKEAI